MLTFTGKRFPTSVDELDAVSRDQLRICGLRWDGEDLPPEQRLFAADTENETNFYTRELARWDVLDGSEHVYDAWFFAVDSGVVFRAGTTDVVCVVVQFDFQSDEDAALAAALAEAATAVGAV